MKIVVLKGADATLSHAHAVRPEGVSTRTAGAVAVSADTPDGADSWVLLNVSPAVADQLTGDVRLLEHTGLPDPATRAVVLTSARVDHLTGLLGLRDGPPIHLYATPAVFEELTLELPVLPILQHYCNVHWHVIPVAGECRAAKFYVAGLPTLEFSAIATDGMLPAHSSRRQSSAGGETIALAVRDTLTGHRFFCTESLADTGAAAMAWMREADCVLVCDEDAPSASDELNLDLLDLFAQSRASRKLLLREQGRAAVPARHQRQYEMSRRGIEFARDRMQIHL